MVCIDANVYISALAFGGKPLKIVQLALSREFLVITSPAILAEVRRNLVNKLELNKDNVDQFIDDMFDISSVFIPSGKVKLIEHAGDSLVLETALMGGANIIVTGDKKHLLPLKVFQGVVIEAPSTFLSRFEYVD